jgi:hypothetical protein
MRLSFFFLFSRFAAPIALAVASLAAAHAQGVNGDDEQNACRHPITAQERALMTPNQREFQRLGDTITTNFINVVFGSGPYPPCLYQSVRDYFVAPGGSTPEERDRAGARRLRIEPLMRAIADGTVRLSQEQQSIEIKGGFITGNTYREYSDDLKTVYVMGVIDGMLDAPGLGAPKKRLAWLETCVVGMNGYQVAAIVDKALRDIPEHWHEPMNGEVLSAMATACKAYRH